MQGGFRRGAVLEIKGTEGGVKIGRDPFFNGVFSADAVGEYSPVAAPGDVSAFFQCF